MTTVARPCRSPLCANVLRVDNETGFCRTCQKLAPGRRWYLRTRPDFHERVLRHRLREKAFKEDKRAHGLCIQCFKPNPGRLGKAKCRACQDTDTRQQRERRQRRRAA